MRALLERLDALLRLDRPAWAATLAPGARGPLREHAGRALPEDLDAWFRWHDGHRVDPGGAGLVLDWKMLSLAQSLAAAGGRREAARRGFARIDPAWGDDWLPLFARPAGDLLVVALDDHPGFAAGAVVEVSPQPREVLVRAPSFRVWAEALVSSLDAGEWRVNEQGAWVPQSAPVWDYLVLDPEGYPQRFAVALERPTHSPTPTGVADLVALLPDALADAFAWVAPPGFSSAPERLTGPRLAAELTARGSLLEVFARDTPDAALCALDALDLRDLAVRTSALAATARWVAAVPAFTGAWCVAFAARLEGLDDDAARTAWSLSDHITPLRGSSDLRTLLLLDHLHTRGTLPPDEALAAWRSLRLAPHRLMPPASVAAAARVAHHAGAFDAWLTDLAGDTAPPLLFDVVPAAVALGEAAALHAQIEALPPGGRRAGLALHLAMARGMNPSAETLEALAAGGWGVADLDSPPEVADRVVEVVHAWRLRRRSRRG
jgi:cell wall assembly regulator SMI1